MRWLSGCERDLPEEVLRQLVDGPINWLPIVLAGIGSALLVTTALALESGSAVWVQLSLLQCVFLVWRLELQRRLRHDLKTKREARVDGIMLHQLLWAASLGVMAVAGLMAGGAAATLSIAVMLVVASLCPALCIGRPRLSLTLVLLCDLPLKLAVPFQSEPLYWVFILQGPVFWLLMDWFSRQLSAQTEASLLKSYRSRLEADYDHLTRLYSRQGFYRAVSLMRRRLAGRVPVALLYVDLDGFKDVNDRLGHEEGDNLLIQVADCFRDVLRNEDLVARWGGDEFLLLLPGADEKTPVVIAERLLRAIREMRQDDTRIDASIGISRLEDARDLKRVELEKLIRRADHALYRAKNEGKGRYHSAFEAESDNA